MKKLLYLTFFFLFNFLALIAQPTIQWEKSLGGTLSDYATSLMQTSDGGYIVSGSSKSNDGDVTGHQGGIDTSDYWIVKLNNIGSIQWQKSLGGTLSDIASSIQQTSDSGYVLAGNSKSNDGDVTGHHGSTDTSDCWIVKLNSLGTIQWQKSLGGTSEDIANSIQQTADGGYIVAGYSKSNDGDVTGNHGASGYYDCWIVKLNANGIIQWQKSLGGFSWDMVNSIQQTDDGGYIAGGITWSNDGDVTVNHGASDYWVVKLDSTGTIQWQKSYGGSSDEGILSIQQTSDGRYIVAGYSKSNDGDVVGHHGTSSFSDYWILRLDSAGTIQWQKSLGGTNWDQAYSIQQTSDGGYISAGYSFSTDGDVTGHHGTSNFSDCWILKLDSTGTLLWQKTFGGTSNDAAISIHQTPGNDIIFSGYSSSIDGDVTGNHGMTDFWIVKLNNTVGIEENNISISEISVSPNPASITITVSFTLTNKETIDLSLYDITGRLITHLYKKSLNPGYHKIDHNLNNEKPLSDGIYFLNFKSGNFSQSVKVVVVK